MRILKVLLPTLLLISCSATAITPTPTATATATPGPVLCQDYLGGAKFTATAIANHPAGECGGSFSTLFGDSLPLAKTLLSTHKAPSWRVHGQWSDTHSFGDGNIPELKRDAARWEPLCKLYPIDYSPFCEHNLANPDKYMDIAHQVAPDCTIVNVPTSTGHMSSHYKNEIHGRPGATPPGSGHFNFSFDGMAAEDADVTSFKATFHNADKLFFWTPRYNGRWEDNDPTPRPQRTGYPDAKMIISMGKLAGDEGTTHLPANWIYKSHSENHGKGDPRAEKPVVIAPAKAYNVIIGGVGCTYYAPYDKGRFRYYCPRWGYEIATHPVDMVVNKKTVGAVNPVFRAGSFH